MGDDLEVSGRECVVALEAVGFDVVRKMAGATALRRGDRIAIVPDTIAVARVVLDRILDSADLTFEELVDLISEAPTMPDLGPALPAR
jgi:hypothetical protein